MSKLYEEQEFDYMTNAVKQRIAARLKKHTTNLRQEWETPPDFYDAVHAEFHPDLDVCANKTNTKHIRYFDLANGLDGLIETWVASSREEPYDVLAAWCNPGFGNVWPWLKKAYEETQENDDRLPLPTALVLTHASLAADWWQWAIEHATECRLLSPRIQFIAPKGIKQTSNPRDSALWVFRANKPKTQPCHIWQWRWK